MHDFLYSCRLANFSAKRSSVNSEIGRPTRLTNFARSTDFILLRTGPEVLLARLGSTTGTTMNTAVDLLVRVPDTQQTRQGQSAQKWIW